MNDGFEISYCGYNDKMNESIQRYRKFYKKSPYCPLLKGNNWHPSKYASFCLENEDMIPIQQLQKSPCLNYPNGYTKLIRENEQRYVFLNEALIKTYPLKNLMNVYARWFKENVDGRFQDMMLSDFIDDEHLLKEYLGNNASLNTKIKDYAEVQDESFDNSSIDGLVTFYVPMMVNQKNRFNNVIMSLADSLYVCGWNLANHSIIQSSIEDETCILAITFEAKYFDIDFQFSEYLYHVTKVNSLKNINRNGLVPRSQNSTYQYPDRVYLFNNCSLNEMMGYMYEKMNSNNDKFAILRIDSNKLQDDLLYRNGKMKFYIDQKYASVDHNSPVAIFTYNNVPRRLIDNDIVIYSIDDNGIPQKSQKKDLTDFT